MQADLTVIIPFYNDHKTIKRALESVKNQILQPKEIVVIDDHSIIPLKFEDIKEILSAQDINIILLRNTRNQGASASRNSGIIASSAKYICFLDADDSWHPEKINIQYNLMLNYGIEFTFHNYSTNSNHKISLHQKPKIIKTYRFIFGNYIYTPTVMCLKKNFVLFDKNHLRMEDYKCWIENSIITQLFYIDELLAYGHKKPLGHSGLSASIALMHKASISVIKSLRKEKKISFTFYIFSTTIEYIKYPLRFLK